MIKKIQIQTDVSDALHATVCNISSLLNAGIQDIHSLRKDFFFRFGITDRLDLLIKMLNHINLTTFIRSKIENDDLFSLTLPVIILYNNDYVILYKINNKHSFLIHSRYGKQKILTKELFNGFSGLAIEISKGINFKPNIQNNRFSIKDLLNPLFKEKDSYKIMFLSSLLLIINFMIPILSKNLLDNATSSKSVSFLFILIVLFLTISILDFSISLFRDFIIARLGNDLIHRFKLSAFEHSLKLPLKFFNKMSMTLFLARFGMLGNIKTILSEKVLMLSIDSILSVLSFIVLFYLSWELAFVSIFFLICYGFCQAFFNNKKLYFEQKNFELFSEERLRMQETIESLRSIRIFRKEEERLGILHRTIDPLTNSNFNLDKIKRTIAAFEKLINNSQNFFLLTVGCYLVIENKLSLGTLFAIIFYQKLFIDKTYQLINVISELLVLDKQVGKFSEIVCVEEDDLEGKIKDKINFQGNIEVSNLTFRYDEKVTPIFNDLSFSVKSGESIAIIGPSGIGKSTLFYLLTGLYRPEKGNIFIDGHNIYDVIDQYRDVCSIVLQEDKVLSGSIYQNIAFTEKNIDYDQVIESCKKAQIHDFIMNLPSKYDTTFEMGLIPLSGGQKQRILIARALYKNPKILFLDEASSALDVKVEQDINRAIKAMNCTRVIVAHRPDTIRMADRILEVTEKNIKEISKEEYEQKLQISLGKRD